MFSPKGAAALRSIRLAILVLEPVADRVAVQFELPGYLAHAQLLLLTQGTDLAIGGVSNHGWPPCENTCESTSLRLRVWPERAEAIGSIVGGSSDSTW